MSIQKQFTYTRQYEGTASLDEETLYRRFKIEGINLKDMVIEGASASITISIDIEDLVIEALGKIDPQGLFLTWR